MPSIQYDSQYYFETLIVANAISSDFTKTAETGFISGLVESVKNYVSSHIDPNNKVESIINILTPGIFAAMGFPIIGGLLKAAEMYFDFNPGKILSDAFSSIKSLVLSNQQISPQLVDEVTNKAVLENYGNEPTESDLKKFNSIREIQIYKMALDNHIKQGQAASILKLIGMKHKTASILSTIISWIIKTVLMSAGFMVGGDLISKFVGSDKGVDFSAPKEKSIQVSLPPSHQNIFKVNPSYVDEKLNINSGWIEQVPPDQIDSKIIQWTQEIYPELANKPNIIRQSNSFNSIVNYIKEYNSNNTSNITFMPKVFTSKKRIVDAFIDDVANLAPIQMPNKKQKPGLSV